MRFRPIRASRGAVLALACLAASGAAAQTAAPPPAAQAAPQPAPIDRNGVLILIRSTLLALQQANETGNYTVLRDLGSPGFREANTAARLAEIFANQRAQRLDLSGVSVLEPQLTLLPQIEPNGMMRMAGFFPSVPVQVNFELLFAPVEGRWRIFGLSVTLGSAAPAAPQAQAPPGPSPEPKRAEPARAPPRATPPPRNGRPSSRPAQPSGSDPSSSDP